MVNNVESVATVPWIVEHGGAAYAALGRGEEHGQRLVCVNATFARPGVYEVPLGIPLRVIVEDLAGGLQGGRRLRALQVGGPLGGFLPASRLDVALSAPALAAEGVSLGHASLLGFDDSIPGRAIMRHLWRFAAAESCGSCSPCRIGSRRGLELVAPRRSGGRARAVRHAERDEPVRLRPRRRAGRPQHHARLRGRARPGGGRPMTTLEVRGLIALEVDGRPVEMAPGSTVLEACQAAGVEVPTLCWDPRLAPFGSCRVCLVGVEGARGPVAACVSPAAQGMRVDTTDRSARADARAVLELIVSQLPERALDIPAERSELVRVCEALGVAPAALRHRLRRPRL